MNADAILLPACSLSLESPLALFHLLLLRLLLLIIIIIIFFLFQYFIYKFLCSSDHPSLLDRKILSKSLSASVGNFPLWNTDMQLKDRFSHTDPLPCFPSCSFWHLFAARISVLPPSSRGKGNRSGQAKKGVTHPPHRSRLKPAQTFKRSGCLSTLTMISAPSRITTSQILDLDVVCVCLCVCALPSAVSTATNFPRSH